jgi:hypothetical protein
MDCPRASSAARRPSRPCITAGTQGWYPRQSMTTAELIAMLRSEDPRGSREMVIWDVDQELVRGVEQVVLRDDRIFVRVSRRALTPPDLESA